MGTMGIFLKMGNAGFISSILVMSPQPPVLRRRRTWLRAPGACEFISSSDICNRLVSPDP